MRFVPGEHVDLIPGDLAQRLHRRANAARWRVSASAFAEWLQAGVERAFAGRTPSSTEVEHHLGSLRLEDLALACACAGGDELAWEHVLREYRPPLYRAADALDPSGGARDLADSLYAELYGLHERGGARRSLFRYYSGRASLVTWLRAVLAQRYVDRLRDRKKTEPLPEADGEQPSSTFTSPLAPPDTDRSRYLDLVQRALALALSVLIPRDRLRLACYYAQQMTLSETGRVLGEHEATVSRHLARTRKDIRRLVERELRDVAGLDDARMARAFECVVEDPGPFDLDRLVARKEQPPDRSI